MRLQSIFDKFNFHIYPFFLSRNFVNKFFLNFSEMAYNSEFTSETNQQQTTEIYQEEIESQIKINKTLKTLQFSNPGKLFSSEAQGKRKPKSRSKYDSQISDRPLYDEYGILIASGQDICDCLRNGCPGCHFPCKQCKSTKCGNKCRVNRNWYYEKIEIEGLSKTLEMHLS